VLHIKTVNQSKKNIYVEKVVLNGITFESNFFTHSDIANGGELVFYMSDIY